MNYSLAIRLTGKFKTAFPDGAPQDKKDEKADKKDDKKPEEKKAGRLAQGNQRRQHRGAVRRRRHALRSVHHAPD